MLRAQQAARASHDLLRSIVENVPIRVFWKDRESRYLGCNRLFAHDAGMSRPEDLLGKDDFQMAWREQAELYRADDKRVMDSGEPKIGYEEPQTTPQGLAIWLRSSKVPLRDPDGKVFGMLGIYDDITESKLAAEAMQYRGELLHGATTAAAALLTKGSLDEGLAAAIEAIGKAARVDRVVVLETKPGDSGPPAVALLKAWHSPRAPFIVDAENFARTAPPAADLAAWMQPLSQGRTVATRLGEATGGVRRLLEALGIKSILLVPVLIDGKIVGQVGFDERLQALGVNIAIDDFGSQYSSLDYLKIYRVNRLKIPRLMLGAARTDTSNAAMVRAIIGIARELNIEIVAQGIENEQELALLTSAPSTTRVQGFYYSEPVPASQAEALLKQRVI